MNAMTVISLVGFVLALSAESVIQFRFWRMMQDNHPAQMKHFNETLGKGSGYRAARVAMLYLRDRSFRLSLNGAGSGYCNDNRRSMIFSYWATAITGCILLVALIVYGW